MAERRLSAVLIGIVFMSGCSFAPVYRPPAVDVPPTFKEAGAWQPATPADRLSRDGWWTVYRDPTLDRLETRLDHANPDIALALARHDEAAADLNAVRAGRYPAFGLDVDASRNRASAHSPLRAAPSASTYQSYTIDADLDYGLDLWGKVRNAVQAGRDLVQANTDDLASVRLSLQASLANTYFTLRGLDTERQLLDQTISTYQRAVALTRSRHAGGIASGLDVTRAETQLDTARAQAADLDAQRARAEHAIASLMGVPASSFTLAPTLAPAHLPSIPAGLPVSLLERRPDIAAAERRVASANAQIGVARAAYFPDLTIGLDGGFLSDTLAPWVAAPNAIWSLGPSLAMTLFDGGRRHAVTQAARAKLAEQGAQYKAVVLRAFQQVEDNLARLHHFGDEAADEGQALTAARQTLKLAMSRYRDGVVSYLDVVASQTTELNTDIAAQQLATQRLRASVRLIEALGGGWRRPACAHADATSGTNAT
ncbi:MULTISPECIES: efflux transporter outer membrane subunit [unclassified Burkholderia]|uniref:efflux transporter outer membrane subunit n=1 Tax=unclassified Burkholderia TaxID=2613784 RepID=UPI0007541619|nr:MULTISPECIES: efflux transporter outer membrane subunit [unclassified Burkholderia]KUY50854.1 RND transporter [Burkholderia sp. RF2-non_BP3]KUY82010.1 RND transporter [Burkholderia sp. RF4-BP95]KUY95644.1 RND transporter [Burkholderia sp. RF7-non_BP1]KUY98948.1 RND transporter [Burkholderia sp. RF7-non_BP4]